MQSFNESSQKVSRKVQEYVTASKEAMINRDFMVQVQIDYHMFDHCTIEEAIAISHGIINHYKSIIDNHENVLSEIKNDAHNKQ